MVAACVCVRAKLRLVNYSPQCCRHTGRATLCVKQNTKQNAFPVGFCKRQKGGRGVAQFLLIIIHTHTHTRTNTTMCQHAALQGVAFRAQAYNVFGSRSLRSFNSHSTLSLSVLLSSMPSFWQRACQYSLNRGSPTVLDTSKVSCAVTVSSCCCWLWYARCALG